MKSVIYVLDTYEEYSDLRATDYNIDFVWQEFTRNTLTEYSENNEIDIVFVGNTHPYILKYRKQAKAAFPNRKDFFKLEKFIRWNIFAESDYDYAYFVDLDTLVLNPSLNLDFFTDHSKFYCNSFERGRRDGKKINPLRRERMLAFSNKKSRLYHFSSGFMACNKQHALSVIDFLNNHDINIMEDTGIQNIIDFVGTAEEGNQRGLFTDEVLINMALNSDCINESDIECASDCGLCEEFWVSNKKSIFFHVISNEFDKQRVIFLLSEFLREYKNDN